MVYKPEMYRVLIISAFNLAERHLVLFSEYYFLTLKVNTAPSAESMLGRGSGRVLKFPPFLSQVSATVHVG